MPVLGQTPVRTHWEDSESVTFEKIGAAYTDPNDSTKLVQDVMAHANLGRVRSDATASATVDQDDMGYSVVLDDASPAVPIAASLDSSVDDRFMCFVLNESTQTATLTPTSGDINDGTGATSSKTLAPGTSCALFKTSLGSPAVAHWKMLAGGSGGSGTGTAWYVGAGVPSTLHNDGDFYLNSTNGDVYEQVSGSWGSPVANIKGPTGATGATGATGSAGPAPSGTGFVRVTSGVLEDPATVTLDTDGTLAANSDSKLASQKATKTYADTKVSSSRTISTTAPLTGGGDLSADRTIAISTFVGSGVGHAAGAVPDPGSVAGTTKFLCEDSTFKNVGPSSLTTHSEPLTDGASNFIFAGGDIIVLTGVPN